VPEPLRQTGAYNAGGLICRSLMVHGPEKSYMRVLLIGHVLWQ